MADQMAAIGLNAVPIVSNNYHKVLHPIQNTIKKMKGDYPQDDPDLRDHRNHDEKGYVLRRRSQVASDEEIVETVRHRGEVVPRRPRKPGMDRRSSSMNNARENSRGYRGYDEGYDSEGSVPPRSRTRAKSQSGKSRRQGNSSSDSSESELGSSTDEEKQCRKIQRKKWLTAGLASVATVHAASKVYSSIEAHDKRILDVQAGKLSPEEAHKKQRATRWQDAAAIAIAALGIKGAISEWNEVQEEHSEHRELMRKKEEHHQKRLERQRREKAKEKDGYYKGRDGNWYYDGEDWQTSDKRSSDRRASSGRLDGPRNGDRKMIEPPSRSRGRGSYDDQDDSYYNDARRSSRYGNDDRRRSSRYDRDDRN